MVHLKQWLSPMWTSVPTLRTVLAVPVVANPMEYMSNAPLTLASASLTSSTVKLWVSHIQRLSLVKQRGTAGRVEMNSVDGVLSRNLD